MDAKEGPRTMMTRLTGVLERVEGNEAVVASPGGETARQVLIPTYLAGTLTSRVGGTVTLHTLEYLESPNQGASFIPRLVGFGSERERRFFELLTTVKGIGNRKALRALAEEPSVIAGAVMAKDARALTQLPEIGKRLAETIIVELTGKVEGFMSGDETRRLESRAASMPVGDPVELDAVEALVALGETRGEAQQLVARASGRIDAGGARSVETILDAVFAARAR